MQWISQMQCGDVQSQVLCKVLEKKLFGLIGLYFVLIALCAGKINKGHMRDPRVYI